MNKKKSRYYLIIDCKAKLIIYKLLCVINDRLNLIATCNQNKAINHTKELIRFIKHHNKAFPQIAWVYLNYTDIFTFTMRVPIELPIIEYRQFIKQYMAINYKLADEQYCLDYQKIATDSYQTQQIIQVYVIKKKELLFWQQLMDEIGIQLELITAQPYIIQNYLDSLAAAYNFINNATMAVILQDNQLCCYIRKRNNFSWFYQLAIDKQPSNHMLYELIKWLINYYYTYLELTNGEIVNIENIIVLGNTANLISYQSTLLEIIVLNNPLATKKTTGHLHYKALCIV